MGPVRANNPPHFPLYPWFGGKSRVAEEVWRRFGDVDNYVEPFYGGGAVHLLRPHWDWARGDLVDDKNRIETVNDADGLVANLWRAVQADPDAVACWADWPVNEADLHARHLWLTGKRESLTERLMADPDWFDVKIAGWWLWGICQWIGGSFASGNGPWTVRDGRLVKETGSMGVTLERPHLNRGMGILRKRPHLGNTGMGFHRVSPPGSGGQCASMTETLRAVMRAYADRMRCVRVCCGDWARVVGPTPTYKLGLTAVFLDPPYPAETGRNNSIYTREDLKVSHDAYEWCLANGDNPLLRIAFCSYDGVYEFPPSWSVYRWTAHGGYGLQGNGNGRENRRREVIYFSPHCTRGNMTIFDVLVESNHEILRSTPSCACNMAGREGN